VRFIVRIRLISPIGLFKTSSIDAKLFYLESSSLRIRRLSYLGQRRARV